MNSPPRWVMWDDFLDVPPPSTAAAKTTAAAPPVLDPVAVVESPLLPLARELIARVSAQSQGGGAPFHFDAQLGLTLQINLSVPARDPERLQQRGGEALVSRHCVLHVPIALLPYIAYELLPDAARRALPAKSEPASNSGVAAIALPRGIPLLLYYHGYRGSAWWAAMHGTGWRARATAAEPYPFLVAYGQGRGTPNATGPFVGSDGGGIGFGDLYWGIATAEAPHDFEYTKQLIASVEQHFPRPNERSSAAVTSLHLIDRDRVYYCGHSNGSLFATNLALRYGSALFAAMMSLCGGYGGNYPESVLLTPTAAADMASSGGGDGPYPVPIWAMTGDSDIYEPSVRRAAALLEESRGCAVRFTVRAGYGHVYYRDMESALWEWCQQFIRPPDTYWTALRKALHHAVLCDRSDYSVLPPLVLNTICAFLMY